MEFSTFLRLCLLFGALSCTRGDVYFPPSCSSRCGQGSFISKLPVATGPTASGNNRAYAWSVMALIQIKQNFEILSPPSAARVCAIVGSCLYEAAALNRRDYLSDVRRSFKFAQSGDPQALTDALDGAGYWALRALFSDRASFATVESQYTGFAGVGIANLVPAMEAAAALRTSVLAGQILSQPLDRVAAVRAGAAVCQRVIEKYTADGFTPRGGLGGKPNPANYGAVNAVQRRAGITDCDAEITDLNKWQPLCIPTGPGGFGTTNCVAQGFLYPWAGRYTPFALQAGNEQTGRPLSRAPPAVGTPLFRAQWEEVLRISGNLGDVQKVVAEYWADGPDTTLPAGHFWKIAADAARAEALGQAETARLLFIVGNAVYDAGIASWRTKTSYDYVRPLQMIQCGAYRGQERRAWLGPYRGTGLVNISEWRPYQATTFVTPPFAAYTSGHSTFSAAASEALRLYFQSDDYKGPSCDRINEGQSLFEPQSGAIPGVSNVPNTGPGTPGYVPAEDVILCWNTFTAASDQSGQSRLFGGIHIKADDTAGQALGRRIGRSVFGKANRLKQVAAG